MSLHDHFDAVIVGSDFGASVVAVRRDEHGQPKASP
jgi:hypothetical protein